MKHTITSSELQVSVKEYGAEICSIIGNDATEYMWQGDAAVWPRQAPNLFPIVGRLKNDCYTLNGKSYPLASHGFARDMEFELISKSKTDLCFQLVATEASRLKYPFDFALEVYYRLKGNCLTVEYDVQNRNDTDMPFSLGAHPGFALSWREGDRIEDYSLEFDRDCELQTNLLNDDTLLTAETETVLDRSKSLPITQTLFARNSLNILKHSCQKVSLCSKTVDKRLSVEFSDFPQLGLWSKPGAAYVCIEPWFGHADFATTSGDLQQKEGIVTLGAHEGFSCAYTITID
jgi:galactose mutarotase-like enzyme